MWHYVAYLFTESELPDGVAGRSVDSTAAIRNLPSGLLRATVFHYFFGFEGLRSILRGFIRAS